MNRVLISLRARNRSCAGSRIQQGGRRARTAPIPRRGSSGRRGARSRAPCHPRPRKATARAISRPRMARNRPHSRPWPHAHCVRTPQPAHPPDTKDLKHAFISDRLHYWPRRGEPRNQAALVAITDPPRRVSSNCTATRPRTSRLFVFRPISAGKSAAQTDTRMTTARTSRASSSPATTFKRRKPSGNWRKRGRSVTAASLSTWSSTVDLTRQVVAR